MKCRKCNDVIIESDKDALAQQLTGLCAYCYDNHSDKVDSEKLKKAIDKIERIYGEK